MGLDIHKRQPLAKYQRDLILNKLTRAKFCVTFSRVHQYHAPGQDNVYFSMENLNENIKLTFWLTCLVNEGFSQPICKTSWFSVDGPVQIAATVWSVFTSKIIADHLGVTEEKPPLRNQQIVVHSLTCDLCNANYVRYTCCHLHQHVEEHKHFVSRKHFREERGLTHDNLTSETISDSAECYAGL